jgi:hypothetical protein
VMRHNAINEALSTRPDSFEPLFVRSRTAKSSTTGSKRDRTTIRCRGRSCRRGCWGSLIHRRPTHRRHCRKKAVGSRVIERPIRVCDGCGPCLCPRGTGSCRLCRNNHAATGSCEGSLARLGFERLPQKALDRQRVAVIRGGRAVSPGIRPAERERV